MSSSRAIGQVKNRAPAAIQISAEQILREAADRQEPFVTEPVVKIHDAEEYQSHLRDRRKHFEDNIRYRREHIGNWVKYARFEEENREFERARSIFERALEVDHRSGELWLRYAELEMRNEFVNRARNVFDRAVQILPRQDFLWYKYVYMEEMVGDASKTRAVFERWMKWMPDDNAWLAYTRFECRCHCPDRAERVMRRYAAAYPGATSFLRFAKWAEWEANNVNLARSIYESCLSELEPEEARQAVVFKKFAAFEERHGEHERAAVIYKHAVQLLNLGHEHKDDSDRISDTERKKRDELYRAYISFEKKHGDRSGIEDVVLMKQRNAYRKRLEDNPNDYDGWFEWAKLEQDAAAAASASSTSLSSSADAVREVYERAVANVPSSQRKDDSWRRYIYLWIYYAVYEECTCRDRDRAREVYQTCLDRVIPHSQFSFAKVWILASDVLVRQRDLAAARKLLGRALGVCGKEKIYTHYIAMELSLGEIDRCRALYNNYLKAMPHNCRAWTAYAELEQSVGEIDRCRAIYELAVSQSILDMPEVLWKAYIDFEINESDGDRARQLYQRLLERTSHVKVWISYAQLEATPAVGRGPDAAREIFQKAYNQLRQQQQQQTQAAAAAAAADADAAHTIATATTTAEERILLLDAWRVFEKRQGTSEQVQAVESKMPRRIKRKRMRDDGSGWEEYFDYQFPDDQSDDAANNFKILEMAAKWKEQQQKAMQEDSDSDSDLDSD